MMTRVRGKAVKELLRMEERQELVSLIQRIDN